MRNHVLILLGSLGVIFSMATANPLQKVEQSHSGSTQLEFAGGSGGLDAPGAKRT